ncbi:Alpha-ketoglutarate-dependent dioxygenase alkB 7, mitochondrial [Halocaridina rubra]|uniref:Alpha-ketoglutarate-dependent dioxygenase alkB 7, mitochondrial n=1 Tax=Halocaridina rubra TaxID=373956 RepID=A0AAN8XJP1_HALRR
MAVYNSGYAWCKLRSVMTTTFENLAFLQALLNQKCNVRFPVLRQLNCCDGKNFNTSLNKTTGSTFQAHLEINSIATIKQKIPKHSPVTCAIPLLSTQLQASSILKIHCCVYSTNAGNIKDSRNKILLNEDNLVLKKHHISSKADEFSTNMMTAPENLESNIAVPEYLYFHPSCRYDTRKKIISSFQVLHDFLREDEESVLMKDVEPHLKRLKYEFDHWDDAIHGFRETERSRWSKDASPIIAKMREFAFPDGQNQITQVHILDLAKTGVIKPHVDSIRFCGSIICGLCLLSDAVMRLVHVEDKDQVIDVLLPRRCLYLMRDESRYKYTHEVLGENDSYFKTTAVPRARRVSVICRNNPEEDD